MAGISGEGLMTFPILSFWEGMATFYRPDPVDNWAGTTDVIKDASRFPWEDRAL